MLYTVPLPLAKRTGPWYNVHDPVRVALVFACWLAQGLTADEEADNTYCEQLYQDYVNDPDPDKHQTISLEELCKREGVYKRYRGRFLVFIWSLFLRLVFTDQETAAHIETLKPA